MKVGKVCLGRKYKKTKALCSIVQITIVPKIEKSRIYNSMLFG